LNSAGKKPASVGNTHRRSITAIGGGTAARPTCVLLTDAEKKKKKKKISLGERLGGDTSAPPPKFANERVGLHLLNTISLFFSRHMPKKKSGCAFENFHLRRFLLKKFPFASRSLSLMTSLEEFAKAIEDGDSAKVQQLVSTGVVDVNAPLPRRCDFDPPALVHAARHDRKEIVDILLRANAHIDSADSDCKTACHAAALAGHADVLAVLLAAGPNLDLSDNDRNTPLGVAISYKQERCALMLIEAGARLDDRWLCDAAALGTDMLQALVDRGVVVSELRGFNACTLLHIVAQRKPHRPLLLSMLVRDCGVDVDACDSEGNTPCHIAACNRSGGQLRWLVDAGADFDVPNCRGETPLQSACLKGKNMECIILLIAAGADVHVRDADGKTPFHRVAEWNYTYSSVAILNCFVAVDADLDAVDNHGITVRQRLAWWAFVIVDIDVESARRRIAKIRLDLVRNRAMQVCIGLQSLGLDALQMCEILQHACCRGRWAQLIPFHIWWKIATTVKHFQQ
jgi:ankyrin repeat protein